MFDEDLPRERQRSDSAGGGLGLALIEAADRHARRIGVLGCVERRCRAVTAGKTEARARPNLRRVALIAIPRAVPDWPAPIPSAVAYIRVAAA